MMTLPDKKKRKSMKGMASSGAQTPQRKTKQGSLLDAQKNRNYTEEHGAYTYDSSMSINTEINECNPIIGRLAKKMPSQMEMS
jgi:hypothetical protein